MAVDPCIANPCGLGCPDVTVQPCNLICNTGFECPIISSSKDSDLIFQDNVPCWKQTRFPNIEFRRGSGAGGPLPHTGNQYIKLAGGNGPIATPKLYQDFVVLPGTVITISFWHAGTTGMPNIMSVFLGHASVIPLHTAINDPNPTVIGTYTATPNVWTNHTITYTIPASTNNNYAIIFQNQDLGVGGNFIDDVTITLPGPIVIATSNSPVPLGGTINLGASTIPGATYSWTGPQGFISILQNPTIPNATAGMGGLYIVTAIDTNGCVSTSNVLVTIQACNPSTFTVVASSNSPLSIGQPLQLTATVTGGTPPFTYAWFGPNGYTSSVQNPIIPFANIVNEGQYFVNVFDANQCATSSEDIDVVVVRSPCFLITDCDPNGQPPFLTSTDLAQYQDQIVKFCIGGPIGVPPTNPSFCYQLTNCCDPTDQLVVPTRPGQIYDSGVMTIASQPGKCWLFEKIECPGNGVSVPSPNEKYTNFDDCQTCWDNLGISCPVPIEFFQLTNCCTQEIVFIGVTSNTFGSNIGLTVQIPSVSILGNDCWSVDHIPQNTDTTLITTVIDPVANPITSHAVGCDNSPCICPPPSWPDGCYCATITKVENCLGQNPWTGQISEVFETCELCAPKCYLLTDCEGILPPLVVSNDFSMYVGLIIQLEGCNTCWQVELSEDCGEVICVPTVVLKFTTCVECLPPVPVVDTTITLQARRVKPGYNTPGCSPAYTERINCNFAEVIYDQMIRVRYGITVCCINDLQDWELKKQELDLRALCDPKLCPCSSCSTCNTCNTCNTCRTCHSCNC